MDCGKPVEQCKGVGKKAGVGIASVDVDLSRQQLHCPTCGAFLAGEGVCNNPLCLDKAAAPGVPSAANLWRWKRPKGSGSDDADAVRKLYKIPKNALVEVGKDGWGADVLRWFDPNRSSWFGVEQEQEIDERALQFARKLAQDPALTGFIEIDKQAWDKAHPQIVSDLIATPGVNRLDVEGAEQGLAIRVFDEAEYAYDPATYVNLDLPKRFDSEKFGGIDGKKKLREEFRELFPDLNRMGCFAENAKSVADTNYTSLREYATRKMDLWGVGGTGQHVANAVQLADQIGIRLVAEDTCPIEPPLPGIGNHMYLFDYRVDGMAINTLAFDTNTHALAALPPDERIHKLGWANIDKILGYETTRHNRQNLVMLSFDENGDERSLRHSDVELSGDTGEIGAKQAKLICAMLLKAGHDPQARIRYSDLDEQGRRIEVATTIEKVAQGYQGRAVPPGWQLSESGSFHMRVIQQAYGSIRYKSDLEPGSPMVKQAMNRMSLAAYHMKDVVTDCKLPGCDAILARFDTFKDRSREKYWLDHPKEMLTEFALMKQALHDILKEHRPKVEARLGKGFVHQFGF